MAEEVRSLDLFEVDVLPGHCSVQADVALHETGVLRIRFRAERPGRSCLRRERKELSGWSGWFDYQGEPIMLRWDTFWEIP